MRATSTPSGDPGPELDDSGSYHHVQGLRRGLSILAAINARHIGLANAAELSRLTGLHRTTVKRLLETLQANGYVRLLSDGASYALTAQVRHLSNGYQYPSRLEDAARVVVDELTRKLVWPCCLIVRHGDALVVRHSAHSLSPLAFHAGTVGAQLPLYRSASGRAWIAFSPRAERDADLARAPDPEGLRAVLSATRRRGYGTFDGESRTLRDFGAISAPIMRGDHVAACIDLVFSREALTLAQACSSYGQALLAAARQVQERLG